MSKKLEKTLKGVGKAVKAGYTGIGASTSVRTIENVNDAVGPFLSLVTVITNLTKEITEAYETVQYNKKTCGVLVNRVEAAEAAVKGLIRLKEENIEKFRDQEYFDSFK